MRLASRETRGCGWPALLVVSLWFALLASGCRGAEPAAPPTGPAGKVVELSGTVTASRNNEVRPLAVGDIVHAEDEISTAIDSAVVIVLDHNGARWALGAGQAKIVRSAATWRAPRGVDDGSRGQDVAEAAGRHAEREGFDTAATVNKPSAAEPATEAAPAEPLADEEPPEVSRDEAKRPSSSGPTGTQRGRGGEGGTGGAALDGVMASGEERFGATGSGAAGTFDPIVEASRPSPPPPGDKQTADDDRSGDGAGDAEPSHALPKAVGNADSVAVSREPVPTWTVSLGEVSGGAAAQSKALRSALLPRAAELARCASAVPPTASPPRLRIRLTVKDKQLIVTVDSIKGTKLITGCAKIALEDLVAPAASKQGEVYSLIVSYAVSAP